ncbi:manganese efflux pump MntP family protein [uncultured Holdemanella sp.]|uniref:manganese efflux pump MntP n=1 Tax=uncultured Holdemanella sp. TaxID=1763549 RepID=UPI0025CC6894|nr:manganese efflux pump MntP family protein [uncultured Holdemanella sp.]
MDFFTILFIGIGLSMDACAVSLAKGMSLDRNKIKKYAFILAFAFGFFQAFMPAIGYFAGSHFAEYIQSIDHWIAFILLGFIGINMIREGKEEKLADTNIHKISIKDIFILAIATSIDALAVGVSFAFLKVNLLLAITTIGITTFILSFISVLFGKKLGSLFEKYAEYLGGWILIILGIKILIEHLFF